MAARKGRWLTSIAWRCDPLQGKTRSLPCQRSAPIRLPNEVFGEKKRVVEFRSAAGHHESPILALPGEGNTSCQLFLFAVIISQRYFIAVVRRKLPALLNPVVH